MTGAMMGLTYYMMSIRRMRSCSSYEQTIESTIHLDCRPPGPALDRSFLWRMRSMCFCRAASERCCAVVAPAEERLVGRLDTLPVALPFAVPFEEIAGPLPTDPPFSYLCFNLLRRNVSRPWNFSISVSTLLTLRGSCFFNNSSTSERIFAISSSLLGAPRGLVTRLGMDRGEVDDFSTDGVERGLTICAVLARWFAADAFSLAVRSCR
mmetsp:Transcript_29563/g.64013  ORF Transcript_29563/g.64013 Transcript_29563/m.64013 type:complete len:209 (+) Transcript_29563:1122-1748(+)